MKRQSACVVLVACISAALTSKLPSNIDRCKRSDPNLNDCLAISITDTLTKLKNGIPNLKIPPLEPLQVPSMIIGEGAGAVHVTQNFRDVKILGATKSNITKVDASKIEEFQLYTESFTPSLTLQANYDLNGRILLIPIQGNGKCTISLNDLVATHTITGEKLEKKGKVYMKVNDYKIALKPGRVQFYFENLFNGDERLGKAMNGLLNENWSDVFEDVKSGYEESLGIIFGDFANRLFTKIPFREVFLD